MEEKKVLVVSVIIFNLRSSAIDYDYQTDPDPIVCIS